MKRLKQIITILLIIVCNTLTIEAKEHITYERLINVIAHIESGQNPNIVSKSGKYVGYLQISKVCVDEANKILKKKKYTYKDRLNKDKSIEIFHIIQNYHNPKRDVILAIRLWSEGLSAKYRKNQTTAYVRKVMKLYNGRYSHITE